LAASLAQKGASGTAWMAPTILYAACVLGAVALYLLLRPGPRIVKGVGAVIAIGALGWVFAASTAAFGTPQRGASLPFFVAFSLIALAAAVRMITHTRPVYSALYFVLVILSSAGLLLLLEAEFMAFALIIVYAGAILITYLFVIMLAQQAPQPGQEQFTAEYDAVPREPAAAAVVGFVLLALLGDVVINGTAELPPPPSVETVRTAAWEHLKQLPDRLESAARREFPELTDEQIHVDVTGLVVENGEAYVPVYTAVEGTDEMQRQVVLLPDSAMPENIEQVGLALITVFPVSLELAGVILLMAMFGAVVLARRVIAMADEEKRRSAAQSPGGSG
jgi:NADH-quinone oxidoreductase subunit J